MSRTPRFVAEISHEFPAGSAGPARSYWDVYRVEGTNRVKVGTVCQPPTKGAADWGHLDIPQLCWMLDAAFQAGRVDKQREIAGVLGL